MKRIVVSALMMLMLGACPISTTGPKTEVLIPEGEPVAVELASGTVRQGELLNVTDTELILQEQDRLVAVPLTTVSEVRVTRYHRVVVRGWGDKLFLFSRYPQGLSDIQWQDLLKAAGQNDFVRPDSQK